MKREYKTYQDNHSSIEINESTDSSSVGPEHLEDTVLRTLTIRKGKCPESSKGQYHKLMCLAWNTCKIETVLETDDDDLLYIFYVCCVSRSVRKRRWNECSQKMKLRDFVDPSDEAFAMLVLENNVSKWMDELHNEGVVTGTSVRKTLYTQGDQGRKWSTHGILRFIELWKICNEYRNNNNTNRIRYHHIEEVIQNREQIWNENSSRKRRKTCDNDDNTIESTEEEDEMERMLQAMVNGEDNSITNI